VAQTLVCDASREFHFKGEVSEYERLRRLMCGKARLSVTRFINERRLRLQNRPEAYRIARRHSLLKRLGVFGKAEPFRTSGGGAATITD